MNCAFCFYPVEQERLVIVPNTQLCSACARQHNVGKKKKGVMIYGHKTAGEIQVMASHVYEEQKKYFIPNGARSAVKNFSKNICA